MDDEVPMISDQNGKLKKRTARSASLSTSVDSSYGNDDVFICHSGPLRGERSSHFVPMNVPTYGNQKREVSGPRLRKQHSKSFAILPDEMGRGGWRDNDAGRRNEHLLMSGPFGLCTNPDCTTCPITYKTKQSVYRNSLHLDTKLNILYADDEGWARNFVAFLNSYFPIMNPHAKVVKQWNNIFAISCLVATFVDPLFFYLFSVEKGDKCIVLNWSLATAFAVVRSVIDFIYLLHIFLQFRLAYVASESRVVGMGNLIDQPRKIALHYLHGYFVLDLFVVLPLPEVMILSGIAKVRGANYAIDISRVIILVQYIPRICRFTRFLAGQPASGFIFESAWSNFVINLPMFVFAGHVTGTCWYHFGLQRVNQCLQDACSAWNTLDIPYCEKFIYCGTGGNVTKFESLKLVWLNDSNAIECFTTDGNFDYGIYRKAVLLTTKHSIINRYVYSFFWGFQQISTLAGNLDPSYFVSEVLFTVFIIGLGLFLFPLLIGNMQNFLQALDRRRLEKQLRQRDVERWMNHRRLPEGLKGQEEEKSRYLNITQQHKTSSSVFYTKVREAERYSWAATRGVNEEELLENLPEDLQRAIRRHFFKFLKKVRIFSFMDEAIIDVICEKLRQKFYRIGSDILYEGGPVEMVFIVRGKVVNIEADGNISPLAEGDVCGEELLMWYLEHSSVHKDGAKIRFPGNRLFSTRTVKCKSNVEAFALRVADLEEVTVLFGPFLRNPDVQAAIRYESPYWRNLAAVRIQVAWRYRQRRMKRNESQGASYHPSGSYPPRY